ADPARARALAVVRSRSLRPIAGPQAPGRGRTPHLFASAFFVHPARFFGAVSTARTDDESLVHVGSRVWAGRSGLDAELRQQMVQLGTGAVPGVSRRRALRLRE